MHFVITFLREIIHCISINNITQLPWLHYSVAKATQQTHMGHIYPLNGETATQKQISHIYTYYTEQSALKKKESMLLKCPILYLHYFAGGPVPF